LVVRKLDKELIDNDSLFSEFSKIGNVVCSKVSKTMKKAGENAPVVCESNGYGYVRFDTVDEAKKAVEILNGKKIGDSEIIVELYDKEAKTKMAYNNLYVKEFPLEWSEDDLRKNFEKYGELGSITVVKDEDGKSKGFGFVCYTDAEAAKEAAEKEHERKIGDKTLYVVRAEKKKDRVASLKKSMARSNVYIRNFDKEVSEESLTQFFKT